jgi:hypothetical protein
MRQGSGGVWTWRTKYRCWVWRLGYGFTPVGFDLKKSQYHYQQNLSRFISLAKLELDSLAKRGYYRKICPIQLTSPL